MLHVDDDLATAIAMYLERLDNREPWRRDALCRERDGDDFFVVRGQNATAAKATCAMCAVSRECLAYAVEHGVRHGVWGGLTERERRAFSEPKRSPAVAVATTCAQCGTVFTWRRGTDTPERRFCSRPCADAARAATTYTITCEQCDQPFTTKSAEARFCSRECLYDSRGNPRGRCRSCNVVLTSGRVGLCCACEEDRRRLRADQRDAA